MHLYVSSLSYHHSELYNLISNMKIKSKIIEISESRLQKSKQYIILLYFAKNLKYKLRKGLNIYHKGMIESTFIEIIDKNGKNMVAGSVYKHPKQTIPSFSDNNKSS